MSASQNRGGKELYEFGPFRVDAQKEILLRGSEPVPLTPKTFQILLVLIRNSEQVVTKDDLLKTVWPDTFVEEANLSRNIFMLRKALGENPQDRYIVTVPGQGYRLAESVHVVPDQELSIVAAKHSKIELQVKESRSWIWISAAATVVVLLAAGAFRYFERRPTVLSAKDTVVLADFVNSTGDPVFDDTLRQGMAVQLEQSPFLSLVSDARVQEVLRLMGQSPEARLTPEIAQEICERTGGGAVLEGSIAPLGSQYVLGLRAKSCHTGETIDEEQVQAARKEDVLNALSHMASNFRTKAGESVATIKEHETPLVEATTPSFEAWKLYSAARRVGLSEDTSGAVPLLQRAIQIDPKFAMAYAFLGRIYGDTQNPELAARSIRKAYELRDRASDPERFFITLSYDMQVTGNLVEAERIGQVWIQTYPRSLEALTLMSVAYQFLGKYDKSAEAAKGAIEISPTFPPGPVNLAWADLYMERYREAEDTVQQAVERKITFPDLFILPYAIAFYKGDQAGMERDAALGKSSPEAADWMTNTEATFLAYSGHLQQARTATRRAIDLASQAHQQERAAMFRAGAAVREAFFGNASEAQQNARAALQLSRGRDVEYGAAFALAVAGDNSGSQALAEDLEKRFPDDTCVKFTYLPVARALLSLNQGDSSSAIEQLQVAAPYDLAIPCSWFGFYGNLYSPYVRGQAYMAAHCYTEAAAEFQKVLDHPGIVFVDPVRLAARLQVGRALLAAGDQAKAKAAYQDFRTLWKDADPDIPILTQAKAEYEKLR